MPEESRDVIVVGAGPAGSALATFLAEQGRDVLLIDRSDFPRDKTCGDGLSPRALRVLRAMGLLEPVRAAAHQVNFIRLFAPNGDAVECAVPPFADLPGFALILPRLQLDDLIRARAVEAGAEFRAGVLATELLHRDGAITGVRAETAAGSMEMRARVTVLATGASTPLLHRAGLLPNAPIFGRAARCYFEGVAGLGDAAEFHFDSVPLPGYGWLFPTSATAANVGAGYLSSGAAPRQSPRQAFDEFIVNPYVAGLLQNAQRVGPVKGYPLRIDFPTAVLGAPGLLAVGEACGLVNPLTGEGIDYGLESAEVAAEVLEPSLRGGDLAEAPAAYTRAARARFLRGFVEISRVREWYFRPWMMNRFVRAANRHDDVKLTLVHIALGNLDPSRAFSAKTLWKIASG